MAATGEFIPPLRYPAGGAALIRKSRNIALIASLIMAVSWAAPALVDAEDTPPGWARLVSAIWVRVAMGGLILVATPAWLVARTAYGPAKRSPAEVYRERSERIAAGGRASRKRTLVCVGSSITHGVASANYCTMAAAELGVDWEVVNAGVNSECSYNNLQRAVDWPPLHPDAVVIMAGTNDVRGVYKKEWGESSRESQGLPELPSLAGLQKNLRALVHRVKSNCRSLPREGAEAAPPRVALCTLPPMGEDTASVANGCVRSANEVISRVADDCGCQLLDVHQALTQVLPEDATDDEGVERYERVMARAVMQHTLFGKAWNDIAAEQGLHVLSDGLHLNDTGGAIVAALICDWVQKK